MTQTTKNHDLEDLQTQKCLFVYHHRLLGLTRLQNRTYLNLEEQMAKFN